MPATRCSAPLDMPYPRPQPPCPAGRRRVHRPRARGQVDDHAAAPLDHLGEDQLGQDDRRHHVGLEVAVEQLDRGVEDLVHVPGPDVAAVVDQHVDPPPLLDDGCHRGGRARPGRADRGRRATPGRPLPRSARPSNRATRAGAGCSNGPAVDECSRSSPSCRVRAPMATSWPARARWTAMALPIPRLAPVTRATGTSVIGPIPSVGSPSRRDE